jgi:hypothetical protein
MKGNLAAALTVGCFLLILCAVLFIEHACVTEVIRTRNDLEREAAAAQRRLEQQPLLGEPTARGGERAGRAQPEASPNTSSSRAAIARKVVILAEVPLSPAELKDGKYRSKIADAGQSARLLIADYAGSDSAALEQDARELFQLRQERATWSLNVDQLTQVLLRQVSDGRSHASTDEMLADTERKRTEADQKFSARKADFLAKYGK